MYTADKSVLYKKKYKKCANDLKNENACLSLDE